MSAADDTPAYSGWCGHCRTDHRLPRSAAAEDAARRWMSDLQAGNGLDPCDGDGKMLGVLVGTLPDGTDATVHAVSGLHGEAAGLAGPTRDPLRTASEERATLAQLSALSNAIERLDIAAARAALQQHREPIDRELARLIGARRCGKQQRAAERASLHGGAAADERLRQLQRASQAEAAAIRAMRRRRDGELQPLIAELERRLQQRRELRNRRRLLSAALQSAFHAGHGFTNFAGRHATLAQLFTAGIPSGAGECCAPKLLQEAARRQIRPHGLAEFWWGTPPADGSRRRGDFYGPCASRCLPLLGHLLCGADAPRASLTILHEDERLIAVDKPAGMLSVPGHGAGAQDCVLHRLAAMRPERSFIRAVHRLDQATSGVLLLALDRDAHAAVSRAFARRAVRKEYVALLSNAINAECGEIDLPIGENRAARPRRVVDYGTGAPAHTAFAVLARDEIGTRVTLRPTTGRTHQLRIHCAAGLGAAIVGDTLYGGTPAPRLMLHAHRIELEHPSSGAPLCISSPLPF